MCVEWKGGGGECRRKSACALYHVVCIVYLWYHYFRILTGFCKFHKKIYIPGLPKLRHLCPKRHAKRFSWYCCQSYFFLSEQRLYIMMNLCIYIYTHTHTHTHTHISECLGTLYELSLLPNNITSDTFWHKSVAARSVDGIFVTGAPAWRWPGQYVTLDKRFKSSF